MTLPFGPPVKPMLAKPVADIPTAEGLLFEPKWDGFRCLAFVDGPDVNLQSRDTRDLGRYFPEVVAMLAEQLEVPCILDGEVVIARGDRLDFEALLARIHPAKSRVRLLAEETPAAYVAFDLLAIGDEDLRQQPFDDRRGRLQTLLAEAAPPLFLTPATRDAQLARQWFEALEGAGLHGVIAKPLDGPYTENQRTLMKIKHARTADCVVAGYRMHKTGDGVGSLLLGLFDADSNLQFVGVASSFAAARRAELAEQLQPLRLDPTESHPWGDWADPVTADRKPGAESRWNSGKDLSWSPLRPELVAEVAYDHMQGTRFRHTTRLVRFRPDREPGSCTYGQLQRPQRFDLAEVLSR
jgi:ATP-dependent DNA ligase